MAPRLAATAVRAMPAMSNMTRARVALGGMGLGLTGQAATDALSGHPSGWQDYVGAALGGGAMAATGGRFRPAPTAALGSGVTSTVGGLLNGNLDPESVEHSMVIGGGLGGLGQYVGERWSNGLRPRGKGKLGEALSNTKSFFENSPVADRQVSRSLTGGGKTILDSTLARGPFEAVESKFGPYARITGNQRLYQVQNPGTVRNHHSMPYHVGKWQVRRSQLSAFPPSIGETQIANLHGRSQASRIGVPRWDARLHGSPFGVSIASNSPYGWTSRKRPQLRHRWRSVFAGRHG